MNTKVLLLAISSLMLSISLGINMLYIYDSLTYDGNGGANIGLGLLMFLAEGIGPIGFVLMVISFVMFAVESRRKLKN